MTQATRTEQLAEHAAALADSLKYQQSSADTTSGRANGYIAEMMVEELCSSQSTAGIEDLEKTVANRAVLAEIAGNAARQRASDQRNAATEAKNAKARAATAARKAATLLLNSDEPPAKRCWRTAHAARAARAARAAPAQLPHQPHQPHQRTGAPAHQRTSAPAHLRIRTCTSTTCTTCTTCRTSAQVLALLFTLMLVDTLA